MKIAILADIHGNILALEKVLKDARSIGVEHYWFLGDYAAIGYDPVGVLERITDLRVSYAVLEADERGYTIQHRRVDYDRQAVIQAVQQINHPALDYIERFMKGENRKDWMK